MPTTTLSSGSLTAAIKVRDKVFVGEHLEQFEGTNGGTAHLGSPCRMIFTLRRRPWIATHPRGRFPRGLGRTDFFSDGSISTKAGPYRQASIKSLPNLLDGQPAIVYANPLPEVRTTDKCRFQFVGNRISYLNFPANHHEITFATRINNVATSAAAERKQTRLRRLDLSALTKSSSISIINLANRSCGSLRRLP